MPLKFRGLLCSPFLRYSSKKRNIRTVLKAYIRGYSSKFQFWERFKTFVPIFVHTLFKMHIQHVIKQCMLYFASPARIQQNSSEWKRWRMKLTGNCIHLQVWSKTKVAEAGRKLWFMYACTATVSCTCALIYINFTERVFFGHATPAFYTFFGERASALCAGVQSDLKGIMFSIRRV